MSCTYAAVFRGRTIEIEARDLWEAKQKAVEAFSAPARAHPEIGIYLIRDSQGQAVNVLPQTF